MSSCDDIKGFFENPFAEDYINISEENLRFAVMSISSACTQLEGACPTDEQRAYLASIMKMCCRLMQSAEMNTQLRNALAPSGPARETVSTGRLLREIAEGCMVSLANICRVSSDADDMLFVVCSRHLLRYLILGIIRRGVRDGAESVVLSAEAADGEVCISVEFSGIRDKENGVPSELNDVYFNDINEVLAGGVGGKFTFDGKRAQIRLPVAPEGPDAELRSSEKFFDSSVFSIYNIMLGDLSDHIFY